VVPCNPTILQNNFILTRNHGLTNVANHPSYRTVTLNPCTYLVLLIVKFNYRIVSKSDQAKRPRPFVIDRRHDQSGFDA